MAFSTILRRSAASAAPLAFRFAGKFRNHHAAVFSAVKHGGGAYRRQLFPEAFGFSTAVEKAKKTPSGSDEKLVRRIDAEIACAEDSEEDAAEIPAGFPFKIEDKSGEQVVKLTRQYEGETIEVEVYMPDLITGDDHDDKDDDDSENSPQSTLPLLVKISKDSGPSLEFSCSANADEVNIDSMSVKDPETSDDMAYEGPDFGDLDENLQKAFHKYLNVRGISPSVTNFLHEYMINKDSKEYKMWLKNLKKFVEA